MPDVSAEQKSASIESTSTPPQARLTRLEESMHDLESDGSVLTAEEVDDSIKYLVEKDELRKVYETVIGRIGTETDFLNPYNQLGISAGFTEGFGRLSTIPSIDAEIRYERSLRNLMIDNPDARARGYFSATDRVVHVYEAPPSEITVLNRIAKGWTVPLHGLKHEV